MKVFQTSEIRNITLAGHSHSGKTSLAEAMLWQLKQSDRLGKTDDGTSVSDYDPEEVRRKCSIQASLIPLEYGTNKINILDLPGFRDFVGEIKRSVRAADGMTLVIDASGGVETGALFAWNTAAEFNRCRMLFVNKLDKEHTSFDAVVEQLQQKLETRIVPMTLPVGQGPNFSAVIDLIRMKLVRESNQSVTYEDIPAELAEAAQAAHAHMVEAAAEGDDELTMKFLDEETLSHEEILRGLEEAMIEARFVPVFAGSAMTLKGIAPLLDFYAQCVPDPGMVDGYNYIVEDKDEPQLLKISAEGPPSIYIFKTVADPYIGRLSFFKVLSGRLKTDTTLTNVNLGKSERLAHLLVPKGKKSVEVGELVAGDIGAVAKLNAHTGDTMIDPSAKPFRITQVALPNPTTFRAVLAKSRSDEDKIAVGFHRLSEQDPTLRLYRDPEINQTILSGMGEMHLEVAIGRLKDLASIDVHLEIPRIAYRETITRKAEGQGKYKKQSGGHGQYGDCWIRFEPLAEGSGFQFEWGIVGGVIPTNFQSAVEKGLVESLVNGVLSGSPMVDFKATCYDGSYHSVDSSDMSFKVAASLAFKNIIPKCGPILLEPINKVVITVPEEYMGDVMSDLNGRRGRILGMEAIHGNQIIQALVPMSELQTYGRAMNSITQGRGMFEMVFDHYERAPNEVQEKVVAETQRLREAAESA